VGWPRKPGDSGLGVGQVRGFALAAATKTVLRGVGKIATEELQRDHHVRNGATTYEQVPGRRPGMTLLSYDIEHPTLRSSAAEWQPHAAQTRRSTEWWYLTSLAFGNVGNPYFLF
jgi:hypothetical protein